MTLCLIGAAATASAQFKIHSNGNMSLQNPDTVALSPVSLNCNGNNAFYMYYNGDKNGICSNVTKTVSGSTIGGKFSSSGKGVSYGIDGSASTSTTSYSSGSVGVKGYAENTGYTFSYGVAGCFDASLGAGVYGTTEEDIDVPIGYPAGKFAGYFNGLTKVAGNFYVTGSINTSSLLGNSTSTPGLESVTPLSTDRGGVTELLSNIRAHTYYQPSQNDRTSIVPTIENNMADKSEKDLISEQIHSKKHYALSAEELGEVFPDLVYTEVDGSKRINYVEMVPLLVQCINELNARLSAVDGGNVEAGTVPARKDSTIETAIEAIPAKTKAVLYQNTPNPFTAQTEIRFSLPDDAPQAYIYIFDMTGKMQKQIPVNPSQQSITINGYELQAGIYLYSLVVGGQEIDTKRMILSK